LSGRIYCIDNDILKKLATFDLFDETVSLFDAAPEQINILPTAKFKFKKDLEKFEKGKLRNSEDKFINYVKTIELAEKLPQIDDLSIDKNLTTKKLFTLLSQFEGIDQGEAILTVYVAQILQKAELFNALIFTGDKNYLRALRQVEIPLVQVNFTHRFWCLEQLILQNINTYGFEAVRNKIIPVRECDKAIKSVFGSEVLSTLENSVATLNSYIETLRTETGNLLHPYPN
jgi:hypothetical protein